MINGSQPQDPTEPDAAGSSKLNSINADPNAAFQTDGPQSSPTAIQAETATVDPDRIALPPGQEAPPAYIRKPSEYLGLRRGLDSLQVMLVLVLAFFCSSFTIRDSDFFHHLASGRALSQGVYQFGKDPFCYTTEDVYWVNHSWIYDWGLYHLFNLVGGAGLVVIKAILVTLLAFLMFQIRRARQSLWIPALCTVMAILALSPRLQLQPALVSYLFLGITLSLLASPGKDKSPAGQNGYGQQAPQGAASPYRYIALIVLVALWANLDRWFILGPITIGLFLLGEVIEGLVAPVESGMKYSGSQERRWLAVAFLGSLAAALMNPHHFKAFELPLEVAFGVSPEVSKSFGALFQAPWMRDYFRPPDGTWQVAVWAYYPLVILGIVSFLVNSRSFRWWRLVIWGAFLLATALRVRLIPFFAIVSGPILVLNFQDFLEAAGSSLKESSVGTARWLIWGRVATLLLLLATVAAAWPGLLQAGPKENRRVAWGLEKDESLERAARELANWRQEGLLGAGEKGFCPSLDFTNYCAWFCPEEKGFVDTRVQLFPNSVWQEFFKLRSTIRPTPAQLAEQEKEGIQPDSRATQEVKHQAFRKWGIDHVVYFNERNLLDIDPPFYSMANDPKQWTLLALAGRTALFGWHDPQAPQENNRFAGHAYDSDREAFGPDASKRTIPQQPIPSTERRDEWYEQLTDYLNAKPNRSADEEEAYEHLLLGRVENDRAATKAVVHYRSICAAENIAFGFGSPHPTCLLTGGQWLYLRLISTPSYNVLRPASPLLAIRSARRAVATNHEDAIAYLNLAKAYLQLPEGSAWRDVNDSAYLVSSLRRCQAATALRAAITLDKDSLEGHLLLFLYFGSEKFNYQGGIRGQRNQGAVFEDLALQHLTRTLEIWRSRNKKGLEDNPLYQNLAGQEKELESRVRNAKNEWLVQTNNPNMPLLEKAIQAGHKGLAGEALKTLEGASVPELTASDNPRNPIDRDMDGIRIELDLKLRCGQTDDVYTALYTNDSRLLEQPRLKDLGQVRLPCYKWIAVQYAASVGDFNTADALLKEMISDVRQRNKQELGTYAALFVGVHNNPQIDPKSLPWMLFSMAPAPKPLFVVVWQNLVKNDAISVFQRVPPLAHEEADLNVVRGLLALETGDTKTAREHLEYAHDLANPPELYLRQLVTLGETRPLSLIATAAALNYVKMGHVFAFPTQDFCNLYLRQLQEQDR